MRMRRTWAAIAASVVAAGLLAGCGGGGDGDNASDPIVIGTSLPLTGQDSQTGIAVQRGYEAWERVINEQGGIHGRRVELKILDDASNQNTVISDYNQLITKDKVDYVVGTFSTRLALPALSVTDRHEMLYPDPAGAAPEVFARRSPYYFYTEPATPNDFGVPFAEYIAGLPDDERPAEVAYVLTQDPFTSSTVSGMQEILQEAGVRTALRATYPFGEQNFDPIAAQVKQSGADLLVTAGGFADEVGIVRSLLKAGAASGIRFLYQTNAPAAIDEYPDGVGAENTEGTFWAAGYTPTLDSKDNRAFVAAFRELYDTEPQGLSAFAFAAGQVLTAAAEAVGPEGVDNQLLMADWLRDNSVDTVIGTLRWDETGAPEGTFATGQWQGGEPQIVLPEDLASTPRILNCWRTC